MKHKKKLIILGLFVMIVAACDPAVPTSWFSGSSGGTGTCITGDGTVTPHVSPPFDAWGPGTYAPAKRDQEATGITMTNGSNTYVEYSDQGIENSGSKMTECATNPSNVFVTGNVNPNGCSGCVQAFPAVQQSLADYNPTTKTWGGSGSSSTPVADLTSLDSHYNLPQKSGSNVLNDTANGQWEAAYDLWPGYNCGAGGSADAMLWVDTSAGRGNGGAQVIGTSTWDGQSVTYEHFGNEYIIQLNTNQISGTVPLLDVFYFLMTQPVDAQGHTAWADCTGHPMSVSEVDFGWELCGTNGVQAFQQDNYSLIGTTS